MERQKSKLHAKEESDVGIESTVQVPASPPRRTKRRLSDVEEFQRYKPQKISSEQKDLLRQETLNKSKERVREREEQAAMDIENGHTFLDRLVDRNNKARKHQSQAQAANIELDFNIRTKVEQHFAAGNEPVSKLKMNPMYISMDQMTAEFQDKLLVTVSDFYGLVSPPDYHTPTEHNLVVIGVVAKKGQVSKNRAGHKMIAVTLTDFQLEITLMIQSNAFDMYWKVLQGSVVAILNPSVYVTQNRTNNRKTIGLSLHTNHNCLLELGSAEDLGFCKATTASGSTCNQWINKNKGSLCNWHSEEQYRKASQHRMDLQSVKSAPFAAKYRGAEVSVYATKHNRQSTTSGSGRQYFMDMARTAPGRDEFGNRTFRGSNTNIKNNFELTDKDKSERETKTKERLARETKLRQKLAQLPDGEYFRRYDENGNWLDEEDLQKQSEGGTKTKSAANIFSANHVKNIGFNPITQGSRSENVRIDTGKNLQRVDMGHIDAKSVQLGKPKRAKVILDSDSDEELEIVY